MIGARLVAGSLIAIGGCAPATPPHTFAPQAAASYTVLSRSVVQSPIDCIAICVCRSSRGGYEGTVPTVLYLVDSRPPTDDSYTGVFEAGAVARGHGLDLVRHVMRESAGLTSGYVAATDSAESAERIANATFRLNPGLSTQWIYTIRATTAFHNAEQSLWPRQDATMVGGEEYNRIGRAIGQAASRNEWVSAERVPRSTIRFAHEFTRGNPHFNPDSPRVRINNTYRSGATQASCNLI